MPEFPVRTAATARAVTLALGVSALVALPPAQAPAASAATVAPAASKVTSKVITRMTVYPHKVTDAAGNVFAARSGFSGGDLVDLIPATQDIRNTTSDVLYRPEFLRFSGWSKAVPNGTYQVTLKMREGFWDRAGQRVFDVVAEGSTKLKNVDIYRAVGKNAAYDRSFPVTVRDGRLNLRTRNRADHAVISAIVVARVFTPGETAPAPAATSAPTSTSAPAPTAAPAPVTPAGTTRPSGLLFDSGVFPMHKATVATEIDRQRGRASDVIAVFPTRDSWNSIMSTWWMDSTRIPAGFTGTLNVGMPMWPKNGNLSTAARGGYNEQWKQFARVLAARYPTAYVRPGWEMNLPGWYYAATPATRDQWISAFRHAVTSMRSVAPGLRIVWNPNEGAGQTGTKDAAMFWPGDGYVDIVGIDAYDWWPGYTSAANIAKHRDGEYGWNHWLNFAKSKGKKFALPEWGVAPANAASGGDNPQYIRFVYDWLKQNQEWIAFETYFQESASYIRSDLFTSSPKASAEYKRWMSLLAR